MEGSAAVAPPADGIGYELWRRGVDGAERREESLPGVHDAWIAALVDDLKTHRGASLVIAGDEQPAIVHALAHAINQKLDGAGHTLAYVEPVEANPVDTCAGWRRRRTTPAARGTLGRFPGIAQYGRE